MGRKLMLVGGGHAHIQVVRDLVLPKDVEGVLVSDASRAVYSGMLPAVVAMLRPEADGDVELSALCARHGWRFVLGRCVGVLPDLRLVSVLVDGVEQRISYDVLSLDVGSATRPVEGADISSHAHALPMVLATRPIGKLAGGVARFEKLVQDARMRRAVRVLVVGDGAAGVELAAALKMRLQSSLGEVDVAIAGRSERLCRHLGHAMGRAAARALSARGVAHLTLGSVRRLEGGEAHFEDGSRHPFDLAVLATGAHAPSWLSPTNLRLDARGFISVRPTLQVAAYDNVFAAGDCASFGDAFVARLPPHGQVPRAGVFAVRMGPVLTHNLGSLLTRPDGGGELRSFKPQRHFLSLLSMGDGTAIGGKYGLTFGPATWVYAFKSYLDESWQRKFNVDVKGGDIEGGSDNEEMFNGTAVEGAAALLGDAHNSDDFSVQHGVLRRMDNDETFRGNLLDAVSDEDSTSTPPRSDP